MTGAFGKCAAMKDSSFTDIINGIVSVVVSMAFVVARIVDLDRGTCRGPQHNGQRMISLVVFTQ